jgi:putative addiction module component (TIGR02574 family)
MSDPVLELAERSRTLDAQQRERLVELLLQTLVDPAPPAVDAAWNTEIERRVSAHQRGDTKTHDLEDVLEEARRIAP